MFEGHVDTSIEFMLCEVPIVAKCKTKTAQQPVAQQNRDDDRQNDDTSLQIA